MAKNNNQPNVTNLANNAHEGYFGAVAYAQGEGNRYLGRIDHNTRIIGSPVEITNSNISNKVLKELAKTVNIAEVRAHNPDYTRNMTDVQIRNELVSGGKLKAALSFVENAECFNLIFYVDPEGDSAINRHAIGSNVAKQVTNQLDVGFGIGKTWKTDKPKKEEEPNKPDTEPEPDPETPPVPPTPPTPSTPPPAPKPQNISTTINKGETGKLTPQDMKNVVNKATTVDTSATTT